MKNSQQMNINTLFNNLNTYIKSCKFNQKEIEES